MTQHVRIKETEFQALYTLYLLTKSQWENLTENQIMDRWNPLELIGNQINACDEAMRETLDDLGLNA